MTRRLTKQQKAALVLLNDARDMLKAPYRSAVQKAIDLIEGTEAKQLTNLHFDALPVGETLVDPKHPGLILRNGARTGERWFFRTTKPFSTTRAEILIGAYPSVSIEAARDAREKMARVRATDRLPTSPAITDAGEAKPKTVNDLLKWYEVEYCKTKRDSSKRSDLYVIDRNIRPQFGALPIRDWTADKIDAHIQKLFNETRKGREAEKVRTILSTMNRAARGKSKIWAGKVAWLTDIPNPMDEVQQLPDRKRLANKKRENYKPPLSEMRRLVANIEALGAPYASCCRC